MGILLAPVGISEFRNLRFSSAAMSGDKRDACATVFEEGKWHK